MTPRDAIAALDARDHFNKKADVFILEMNNFIAGVESEIKRAGLTNEAAAYTWSAIGDVLEKRALATPPPETPVKPATPATPEVPGASDVKPPIAPPAQPVTEPNQETYGTGKEYHGPATYEAPAQTTPPKDEGFFSGIDWKDPQVWSKALMYGGGGALAGYLASRLMGSSDKDRPGIVGGALIPGLIAGGLGPYIQQWWNKRQAANPGLEGATTAKPVDEVTPDIQEYIDRPQ